MFGPSSMRTSRVISRMFENLGRVAKNNPASLKTKEGLRQAVFGYNKYPKKYRVEGNITKGTQSGSTQGRSTLG